MVSIDRPYIPLHFRNFFYFFLKDPGPLYNQKRSSAAEQLKLHTLQKTLLLIRQSLAGDI